MDKRTAREIIIKEKQLNNKDINIKIGAAEKRDCPDTIYLYISFWAGLKCPSKAQVEREKLDSLIKNIYNKKFINNILQEQESFISVKDSIYIYSVPENFFFNKKKSFISIELYLHTVNINKNRNKIPLNKKLENKLFQDSLFIGNYIGDEIKKIEKKSNLFFTKKQKKTPDVNS